jgi:CubicO group peptidase (beta-lactamase class C family)
MAVMSATPTARLRPVLEALTAIDEFVAARLSRMHAPGIAIGLTDRERTLGFVCQGLASVAERRSVEPDTRFQIGSISKSFAAAVLLQEHEAGRVDLHAPVTEYVPWFAVRSGFTPITLHHLLSHTSGLPMGTELTAEARAALRSLRETEMTCAPGAHFLYSNDGYKLVGLTLEAVTGRPFHELVAERVVDPLGMTATETVIRRDSRLPVASGNQRLCDDRPAHAGRPFIEAPLVESCSADGSIVSSAPDMLAYARLILNRGVGPDGRRLLSDESYGLWTSRVIEDLDEPGTFYGYGLVTRTIDGYECVGHSGGMVGFNSLLVTEPQTGIGVIVLLNGLDDRMAIATYALAAGRAALAGAAVPPPAPPADPTLIGEAAGQYAGAYHAYGDAAGAPIGGEGIAAPGAMLAFVARDGRLVLSAPSGDEIALEQCGDDLFLAPHVDWDCFHLRFERDDGGAVVALSYGPDWFARQGHAPPPAPAADPAWSQLVGTYRSHNPWTPAFRVVSRRGRLLMIAPWLYPSDELDLVPLPDGAFRVGAPDWLPDRLRFDTLIDARTRRAVYDGAPFFRTFT